MFANILHISANIRFFSLSLTRYSSDLCLSLVLERPTSQMSYLEHFLKETTSSTRHGSVDSVEGDIEDNRAPSITSSKSNLSELSIVSILVTICVQFINFSKNMTKVKQIITVLCMKTFLSINIYIIKFYLLLFHFSSFCF